MENFEHLPDQELEEKATNLRNNGQIADAVQTYRELVKRFDARSDTKRAANMQHMIGVSYKVANNTDDSLTALADAKQRYEQAGDSVGVGRVLRDEGITYQYVHNYGKALPLLQESVEVLENGDDSAELGISQAKLGSLYMDQDNLSDAETWIQRGLETLTTTGHWFYVATTRMHLAALYFKRQNYIDALKETEQAEKAFMDHGAESANARRLTQIEAMKALIYLRQGDQVAAERHKSRSVELLARLDTDSARYLREQPELKEIFGQ